MKTASRNLVLAGLCVLGTGCAQEIRAVEDYRGAFVCEANLAIHVTFTPGYAALEIDTVPVTMTELAGGGGRFFYRGNGQSLRQNGADAEWIDDKGLRHHCREVGKAASTVPPTP